MILYAAPLKQSLDNQSVNRAFFRVVQVIKLLQDTLVPLVHMQGEAEMDVGLG